MDDPGVRAGVWAGALALLLLSMQKVKSIDYGGTACDCLGKTRLAAEKTKRRKISPTKREYRHRGEITSQLPLWESAEDDSALCVA